uniref:Uncharacterized protein n=1 Tax=Oryza sativa subsp. japonica TaxID=39947 RepID=Q69NE3_ORYSJ|nr:hypothetical protein [Oryza sativa Japonica Group]
MYGGEKRENTRARSLASPGRPGPAGQAAHYSIPLASVHRRSKKSDYSIPLASVHRRSGEQVSGTSAFDVLHREKAAIRFLGCASRDCFLFIRDGSPSSPLACCAPSSTLATASSGERSSGGGLLARAQQLRIRDNLAVPMFPLQALHICQLPWSKQTWSFPGTDAAVSSASPSFPGTAAATSATIGKAGGEVGDMIRDGEAVKAGNEEVVEVGSGRDWSDGRGSEGVGGGVLHDGGGGGDGLLAIIAAQPPPLGVKDGEELKAGVESPSVGVPLREDGDDEELDDQRATDAAPRRCSSSPLSATELVGALAWGREREEEEEERDMWAPHV